MNWLQQWMSNRKNKESANPIDATNVANKWRNISGELDPGTYQTYATNLLSNTNSTLGGKETSITEGPGTKLIRQEDGSVIRVREKDIIPKEKTVNEKVDSLLSGYDTEFDTTKIINDITEKEGNILDYSGLPGNTGNNDNNNIDTTFTEGSGTKLIQTTDGTVMRVPVDQEIVGSTTIQVDDQAPVGEVNYESIPKDEDFRKGEPTKIQG